MALGNCRGCRGRKLLFASARTIGPYRETLRQAVLKAKHAYGYQPPGCAGTFADVPCASPFAPWIEQLVAENITAGCGGGNFCPTNPTTRGQMAVFLTKAFQLQ